MDRFSAVRRRSELTRHIKGAIPPRLEQRRALFDKFIIAIRATVKGNIVVAIVQGALGGLIFWFLGIHPPLLWAVLMAFLSLLPAVGAGLVWLPVAIYLLVTGAAWQGIVLIAYGVLVIGLIDNILRPVLVGNDTKMPESAKPTKPSIGVQKNPGDNRFQPIAISCVPKLSRKLRHLGNWSLECRSAKILCRHRKRRNSPRR